MYDTTPEEQKRLEWYITDLYCAKALDVTTLRHALEIAYKSQGMFNLLEMWCKETDENERILTIESIKSLIRECRVGSWKQNIYYQEYTHEDIEAAFPMNFVREQIDLGFIELAKLRVLAKRFGYEEFEHEFLLIDMSWYFSKRSNP